MTKAMFLNAFGLRNEQGNPVCRVRDGEGNLTQEAKVYCNSLGAQAPITTLTAILPEILEQKFYTLNGKTPSDYIPIKVANANPYAMEVMNWKTATNGEDFESGFIDMASNDATSPAENISVEPIKRPVIGWKKDCTWNTMQVGMFGQGTQQLDYIEALYKGRKKLYDLGIQEMAFLGSKSKAKDIQGLLTQGNVTADSTTLTGTIASLSDTAFNKFAADVVSNYSANTGRTAMPNRLVISIDDNISLAKFYTDTYPLRTRKDALLEAFKMATGRDDFQILPLAYCEAKYNGLNKNRYALYNNEADSLIMDILLPFTVTMPGTINNFTYTSAAYSRFTGVTALRPAELMYFDYVA